MPGSVYVDESYETGLGTRFYDRLEEMRLLDELLSSVRTIIVYGPRNVGKSELIRYYIARRVAERLPGRILYIDCRRRRAERYTMDARLAEALKTLIESLGVPQWLLKLLELLESLRRPLLVVIDEVHLLYPSPREALADLEALAGILAKSSDVEVRLVVVVSEGFFATLEAEGRLHGYAVEYMLVEQLDLAHFERLYGEYASRRGCKVGLDTLLRLVGTTPGYLVDLCGRSRRLIEVWLSRELERVYNLLLRTASELGIEPREAAETAARLLAGQQPRDKLSIELGEKLVEYNVAYPCLHPRRYLPQLPVHLAALEAIAERGSPTLTLEELERMPLRLETCRGPGSGY